MSANYAERRHREIEALAYRYWEERGKVGGSAEADWFRAAAVIAERDFGELLFSGVHMGPDESAEGGVGMR